MRDVLALLGNEMWEWNDELGLTKKDSNLEITPRELTMSNNDSEQKKTEGVMFSPDKDEDTINEKDRKDGHKGWK